MTNTDTYIVVELDSYGSDTRTFSSAIGPFTDKAEADRRAAALNAQDHYAVQFAVVRLDAKHWAEGID